MLKLAGTCDQGSESPMLSDVVLKVMAGKMHNHRNLVFGVNYRKSFSLMELVDAILQYLSCEYDTLKACALVDPAFCALSQPLLFLAIRLLHSKSGPSRAFERAYATTASVPCGTIADAAAVFAESPHLSAYVCDLVMDMPDTEEDETLLEGILPEFSKLKCLVVLGTATKAGISCHTDSVYPAISQSLFNFPTEMGWIRLTSLRWLYPPTAAPHAGASGWGWYEASHSAHEKMSLPAQDVATLTDCTEYMPASINLKNPQWRSRTTVRHFTTQSALVTRMLSLLGIETVFVEVWYLSRNSYGTDPKWHGDYTASMALGFIRMCRVHFQDLDSRVEGSMYSTTFNEWLN
ncbi:hypothetical protein C8R43DRAFT_941198 [Mycena crocata]|nr:hypothetical protein C8R43DRAFT_941198 [Mycena crocata]